MHGSATERIDFFGIEQGLPDKAGTNDPYVTVDADGDVQADARQPAAVTDASTAARRRARYASRGPGRLELNLLYGIYPGIGGGGRVTEEIADLFTEYAPLFRAINTEGWQPVTRARAASGSGVRVERFGSTADGTQYLTMRNTSTAAVDVPVTFETSRRPPRGATSWHASWSSMTTSR